MATKYARGVGGAWQTDATWSTTSGGAADTTKPLASDDAVLDASSGAVTIDSGAVCRSLDCLGYTGVLTHTAAVTLSIGDGTPGTGNRALRMVAGMTYTLGAVNTSGITYVSTSSTQQTLDFGGKNQGFATFNGVGGSWIFSSALVMSTTAGSNLTLLAGTVDTNNFNVTGAGMFSSGALTRVLTLGSTTVQLNVNGNGGVQFAVAGTGITLNAGTSQVNSSSSNAATNFGTGLAWNNVTVTYGNGSGNISAPSCTFNHLILEGGNTARLMIASDYTSIDLTIRSGSGSVTSVPLCFSDINSVQRTFNVTNTPTITNVILKDIVIAGPATPYATTGTGDGGNNGGMTLSPPRTLYWVDTNGGGYNATTSWSLSSGGASGNNPPMPQDTAIFDANSITVGGSTITCNWQGMPTLDFTNILNDPVISFTTTNGFSGYFGDLILKAGMTGTGTGSMMWLGSGDQEIDLAGVTIGAAFNTMGKVGSTVRLLADFFTTAAFNVQGQGTATGQDIGTFDANGFDITCTTFNSANVSTRTVSMGGTTLTLTGTAVVVWNTSTATGLTFTAPDVIAVTDTSATTKTFTPGTSRLLNDLIITGGGGATVNIQNSGVSYNNLKVLNGPTLTQFSGGNQYIVRGQFTPTGTAGNLVTVAGALGVPAQLILAAGPHVASYCAFTDINANAGASIWAVDNCTNTRDNHNVIFAQPKRLAVAGVG